MLNPQTPHSLIGSILSHFVSGDSLTAQAPAMLSARASRFASTANVTRFASRHVTSSQHFTRFNSSTASSSEEQGNGQEQGSRAPPIRKYASKEPNELEIEEVLRQEKKPDYLLQSVARSLRELEVRDNLYMPYRVRRQAYPVPLSNNPVHVKNAHVHVGKKKIPSLWLRDNCQCAACMHDATKQRLIDTFAIPRDIAVQTYSFEGVEDSESHALWVQWTDGHCSKYPIRFFREALKKEGTKAIQRIGLTELALWGKSVVHEPAPSVQYGDVMKGEMKQMLQHLRKYGFCYVDGTPFEDPNDTKVLLEKIAFIRETHYGGFYDFTADLASKDTAYTNIALEAHTDNTYFSDPAGLQALHLLSHTEGLGGASLLVDGFTVARKLWNKDRKAYNILSTVNVYGHASGNEGISIQPYRGFPVLEHDDATGDLLRVRWNSSDRASIQLPVEHVEIWYDAARQFDSLLKKEENEYWEQLKPGRVLIFDNWRVLHGRSSFTGKRRICGAYLHRDDWISKFKMAEFGQEAILKGLAVN
ncbi:uncharacterized protein SETTUDRAFT_180821 [Exserohilum turcica Et28A]|uniref:Trimethyllysine dioxygenase n=1 Tax=Exserohilum turcicum (strain 28A) TaxID=671987 RepID=R0JMR7_EXST2|nr:uncharacterized protein SETTUDRAFT_180821 [Exserohilum turcica Et28A]EOA82518.1 hypothetical protein SETTUDRAFT_180821 [Exserohilum turcica Et28A]